MPSFAIQTSVKFLQLFQQPFKAPPYPDMFIPETDSKISLKLF